MVVIGNFDTWNNDACGYMVRLKTDGTWTPSTAAGPGPMTASEA